MHRGILKQDHPRTDKKKRYQHARRIFLQRVFSSNQNFTGGGGKESHSIMHATLPE